MLPPPALAAGADASEEGQQRHQQRSDFPSLLAPLERVGRGNNAWDYSEDYGCNSSDSEWYREEEEEEEEKPAAPPPAADLLLPWQL